MDGMNLGQIIASGPLWIARVAGAAFNGVGGAARPTRCRPEPWRTR